MTTKQMFESIMERLDSGALQVGVIREGSQLSFGDAWTIRGPEDISFHLMPEMRTYAQETLALLCLNTKNVVIHKCIVFVGSLNASVVHPREIFRIAIEKSACSIMLVHNHPSGDATPSSEDIRCSRQIQEGGKILGIPLLDHIIIGDAKFVSLKERQLL